MPPTRLLPRPALLAIVLLAAPAQPLQANVAFESRCRRSCACSGGGCVTGDPETGPYGFGFSDIASAEAAADAATSRLVREGYSCTVTIRNSFDRIVTRYNVGGGTGPAAGNGQDDGGNNGGPSPGNGITSSNYERSSLAFDGVTPDTVVHEGGVNGVPRKPRQLVTKHHLLDFIDVAADPATGKGAGYEIRAYPRHEVGLAGAPPRGLVTVPAGARPAYVVRYRNPDATAAGRLDAVMTVRDPLDETKTTVRTIRVVAPAGTATWTRSEFQGDPEGTSSLQPWRVVTMARTVNNNGTETVEETVQDAGSPVGENQPGALFTASRRTTTYAFYRAGEPVVLSETVHAGASGNAGDSTTTWSYFTDPAKAFSFNKPRTVRRSDGSWANHEYEGSEATGAVVTRTFTGWLGGAAPAPASAPDPATCRVVTTTEARKETGAFGTEEKVLGVTVRRSWGERTADAGGTLTEVEHEATGGADLATTRTYFRSGANEPPARAGRLASVAYPDGTVEKHTYAMEGANRVETVERGSGSVSSVTAGTRTRSTYAPGDRLIEETVADIASGVALSSRLAVAFDSLGRPTRWVHDNDPADYSETIYGCCGVERERARDGTVTAYVNDGLKRVAASTATTGSRVTTTSYTYGADQATGLPSVSVSVSANGLAGGATTTVRDLAGRVVSATSPGPGGAAETTAYTYTAAGLVATRTNPDGGQVVTESYPDGKTKSVSGTAVVSAAYSYATHNENGGGLVSTVATAAGAGGQAASYTDLAGRTFRTESTAPHGQTAVTTTTFNALGRAEVVTSSGRPAVKYVYDSLGDRVETWTDRNGDNAFNDAAVTVGGVAVRDSCSKTSSAFVANPPNGIGDSRVTTASVRTDANLDVVVSTTWRSVDGLRARAEALGVANPATSISTRPMNGAWTSTATRPDGTSTLTTVSMLAAGVQRSEVSNRNTAGSAIETTTILSDALGRSSSVTDGRGNRTDYAYNPGGGGILTVTRVGAAPGGGDLATSYGYAILAAGRRTTTTLPDATSQYQETDVKGQVVRQWGSQTNPVAYAYDDAGRLHTHTTFRAPVAASANDFPSVAGDTTTWNHDPSGVLLEKIYPDDKKTTYTYDIAGNLATRVWARGSTATYAYLAGRLASIDYSDSTPDAAFAYDRLGRIASASQSGGASTPTASILYDYDANTLALDKETITIDPDGSGGAIPSLTSILDRSRDAFRRAQGFTLGTEHHVTYGYDVSGRLATIAAQGVPNLPDKNHAWEYSYVSGSDLTDTLAGPVHVVDNDYEAKRDVLLSRKATRGTTTLSEHGYTVNAIGQRTARALKGTLRAEFYGGEATADFPTAWSYDPLGQVTAETKTQVEDGKANRAYAYDQIGNRLTSAEAEVLTSYFGDTAGTVHGANRLNQYMSVSTFPVAPAYDDDGNQTTGAIRPLGATTLTACGFTWDAENRLVSSTPAATTTTTRHTYDAFGRRTATLTYPSGSTTANAATLFIHDGWNLVGEYALESNAWALDRTYTWGLDLSGSPQGAGGVGGLLAVDLKRAVTDGASIGVYCPLYDGNGNIEAYLTSTGDFAAIYQYDAFGNVLFRPGSGAASVAAQQMFHHRFSTKYQDDATGLLDYGLRWYGPVQGRWLSRDPIGEEGGLNVYGFVANSSITSIDYHGLCDLRVRITRTYGEWETTGELHATATDAAIAKCCSGVDAQTLELRKGTYPLRTLHRGIVNKSFPIPEGPRVAVWSASETTSIAAIAPIFSAANEAYNEEVKAKYSCEMDQYEAKSFFGRLFSGKPKPPGLLPTYAVPDGSPADKELAKMNLDVLDPTGSFKATRIHTGTSCMSSEGCPIIGENMKVGRVDNNKYDGAPSTLDDMHFFDYGDSLKKALELGRLYQCVRMNL